MNDEEEIQPEEGDYFTEDHQYFYQYGTLVLTLDTDADMKTALIKHMTENNFFTNVWYISDHGNHHPISLMDE